MSHDDDLDAASIGRFDPPGLNLVTPEQPAASTIITLERVLDAVPAFVQVRTKCVDDASCLSFARKVKAVCRAAGRICLVNDRVDIALAVGADGVHLGERDLPVRVARRLLGAEAILGATCRDPTAARRSQLDGADYLGVGPCFPSRTKSIAVEPLGPDGLAAVVDAVDLPVVGISGVAVGNAPLLFAAGANAVAVATAVFSASEPVEVAQQLYRAGSRS